MQTVARRDTAPERSLQQALHRLGVRYRSEVEPLAGVRRRADIVFRARHLVVYVDGCFWHACPAHATWPKANAQWWRRKLAANVTRDRATNRALRTAGWRVIRIWAHEDADTAAMRIVRALRHR